jgi:hypothetical protein
MIDKVQKIRKELARLKEETSIGLSEHKNGVEQGRMEIINALSIFLDSMQEEPVSEDLEEAVNAYIGYAPEVDECSSVYGKRKAFKAGAKWQKEKMTKDTIKTTIVDSWKYGQDPDHSIRPAIHQRIDGYKAVDKVKIIILKED